MIIYQISINISIEIQVKIKFKIMNKDYNKVIQWIQNNKIEGQINRYIHQNIMMDCFKIEMIWRYHIQLILKLIIKKEMNNTNFINL